MAGQVIMQSFVGFAVPLWVRRLVTMLPAVAVVALGLNVTQTLVVSQVILSFVLPVPVIALVLFTMRGDMMGRMVNPRWVTALAIAAGPAILGLNADPHLDARASLDRNFVILDVADALREIHARKLHVFGADISIHAAAPPSSVFLTVAGAPAATTRGGIAAFCPTTLPAAIKRPRRSWRR